MGYLFDAQTRISRILQNGILALPKALPPGIPFCVAMDAAAQKDTP